jgi:hypothetical protein
MLLPGEDFPLGKICGSRASRDTFLTVKRGGSYVFRAGRNEVILDEQSCQVSTGTEKRLFVIWLGAGLECGLGFD